MSEPNAVCSCGVPGCRELGWPHEWDPIACGDDCVLSPPPVHVIDLLSDDGTRRRLYSPPEATPHKVTAPYVRTGSGYACAGCVS